MIVVIQIFYTKKESATRKVIKKKEQMPIYYIRIIDISEDSGGREMYFEESYFEGEETEGFFVESMMKRAWAAQIEVLKVIEDICVRHGLRYFAERGTLLGAVRHQGFIPWDDDLDISMLREDYERFLAIAQKELPEEFALLNIYTEAKWDHPFARITNSRVISFEEDRLEKFHGCPYVVGIDIFPLDYLSRDKEEEDLRQRILKIVANIRLQIKENPETADIYIPQVEEICQMKIDRKKSINHQLLVIIDRLSQLYRAEESDQVGRIHHVAMYGNGIREKCWYNEMTWVPFETTEISVPSDMHECTKRIFGEKYMTPRIVTHHDYPFYAQQERMVQELLKAQQK